MSKNKKPSAKLKGSHSLKSAPKKPGVYSLQNQKTKKSVYTGQSKDINQRVNTKSHKGVKLAKKEGIKITVKTNTSKALQNKSTRLKVEKQLKKELKPLYDRKKKGNK